MKINVLFLSICASLALLSCNQKPAKQEATPETSAQETSIEANTPVKAVKVIDFCATWCGPCRQMAPIVERLAAKYQGQIEFEKVDIDENPEMASQYEVEAVPTFVIIDAEGLAKRHVGALSEEEFEQLLR